MGPVGIKKKLGVVVWAGVILALFGAMAFGVLVLRDHGHANIMVNEQSAPTAAATQSKTSTAGPLVKQGPTPPQSALQNGLRNPEPSAALPAKQEFSINKSSTEQIRSVRLKLIKTDPAKKIYDIRVITGRRAFTHRHLKIDEPLWIATDRVSAIEMVVTSIGSTSASGYWTESKRPPHVTSRVRSKRR